MHESAMFYGRRFFEVYCPSFPAEGYTLVEIGSQNVNGSLRDVCPAGVKYIGLDFAAGDGVDIVIEDPYVLPVEDGTADVVVSSSCFEHSEFFWLVFLEAMRILKQDGIFYLNAPSNGFFHRWPVDCWRFYPDAGHALVGWANRNGGNGLLLESFVGHRSYGTVAQGGMWNDFVAVFLKDARFRTKYPDRIVHSLTDFTNGYSNDVDGVLNPNERGPDFSVINAQVEQIDAQARDISLLSQALSEHRAQISSLHENIANLYEKIAERDQTIAECNVQLAQLRASRSWQITKPLRFLGDSIKHYRRVARLVMPSIRHGGGVIMTARKATRIFLDEGLTGIRRSLRVAETAQKFRMRKEIHPIFRLTLSRPAEEVLALRVLIIAEMSIPQCTKYRVQQKHDLIESLGVDCTIINWTDVSSCLDALQTHSLVILYRVPAFESVVSVINEAKRLRLPTIWEVDDLIFDQEVLRKSRGLATLDEITFRQLLEGADLYRKAMLLCDRGIASTAGLADAMKQVGVSDVHVIENALDRQTLEAAERACHKHAVNHNGIVRIVYGSGTNTHNIDFEEAAPAIIQVLDKFPNVRLRIVGMLNLPEAFSRYADQVERLPICAYEEYLGILKECDIGIAPLENYFFNESKSNIKFIESSIVRIPSVCSPRSAFAQVIVHGENGFLCETDEEWKTALTLLVTDSEKRAQVSAAAYETIMQRYSPESLARQQVAPLLARYNRTARKLRILSVNCYYYPRSFGGATVVAEEINKRIHAKDDFEVHVFTTLPTSVVPAYKIKRYEAAGINVYGMGLHDQLNERAQFENTAVAEIFANVLAVVQPDIVHFHSIQGVGISTIDLCKEKGIKYVVTLHDAWWLCGRQFMINRQGKYCEQQKINLNACAACVDNKSLNSYRSERLFSALRQASALLAPSRFFADLYTANGFKNVMVNKNGIVRPNKTARRRRMGSLRFGYVGGNTPIKGFHMIRKVFSNLAGHDIRLVLVDNTINLGLVSYHPQDLEGLADVEIVPAYNQSTIDEFFADIDVLLFPTQWKESFGLTVREALARNVWVIVTDAGGVVEDIKHGQNGYIVPFSDKGDDLKQAVIATLRYFEHIPAGETISLDATNITFFEDQAEELASILRHIHANNNGQTGAHLLGIASQICRHDTSLCDSHHSHLSSRSLSAGSATGLSCAAGDQRCSRR